MNKGPIYSKSFAFAVRVVKMARWLQAEHAQNKADFISKMSIALKEANETDYWLDLLHQSEYLTPENHASIHPDIQELIKLLVSVVKTSKNQQP